MRSTRPVSKYDSDEMEMYTDSYLEFVLEAIEEARQDCPDPKVLIEQRLDFSCYVPDGFGTGDCLIVADELLHIIDLKYGQGVLVNTEIESLLEEIDVVTELTKRCIAENSQTAQNQEEYAARYNGFVEGYPGPLPGPLGSL